MSTSTQTSDEVRVLVHALDQAADELDHVHPDDLDGPTPCSDWDVGTLADHLVAAPARFLAMMRGEEPDWSAPPPHLTDGWGGEFRNHADDLTHAWHELHGDPPTPAAWQIAEIAVHTWDLTTALGRPVDRLDPEVAETALAFMRDNLTPEARGHAFGPERSAPAGAGPYAALAAFAGRAAE
ncbi:MAG TPA: TIGR03086 family metal-binding protein [Nocardioides sp.]|nr:TIGR03086 family metal-binding protein [Nocardioides sp.]